MADSIYFSDVTVLGVGFEDGDSTESVNCEISISGKNNSTGKIENYRAIAFDFASNERPQIFGILYSAYKDKQIISGMTFQPEGFGPSFAKLESFHFGELKGDN
ncbi:Uncharacterised protein [Cedecea neteri]|uniref:Uncharacterized protein n=1 Tax=Cedecea neteri TaxID=158822 RepID=A0A291E685_9ENTR|nr:hypothetical protein [Cedecea neteri]ATF95419.1 hypothetical protein CO704_25390 [Cedecea neteri]SQC92168.1 Uncharacterised protein [Cedecea neteri]